MCLKNVKLDFLSFFCYYKIGDDMKYVLGIVIPYYYNSEESETAFKNLMQTLSEQVNNNPKSKLVIIEDGQNSEFLTEYENDRTIILRNETNKGVSYTRNRGIDLLIKECMYLTFIDSDDMISEDFVDVLVEYCQDNTHEIIETNTNINHNYIGEMPKGKHRNSVWGYALQSKIIGKKRFEENKQIGEDTGFMYSIIDLNKHRKKYCKCVYYYQYGINPNSLIKRYKNKEIGKER